MHEPHFPLSVDSQLARPDDVDKLSNIQNEVKQQIHVEKYRLYCSLPFPAGPLNGNSHPKSDAVLMPIESMNKTETDRSASY